MNSEKSKRGGILFVLSAPSGAGKTTVANVILAEDTGIGKTISHTTRDIREGEADGADYHFVDKPKFERMRDNDEFVEWAQVHGNYYGTSFATVKSLLEQGADVMLVIDVQGAESIGQADFDSCSIFLLPPSQEELERRLKGRGTETDENLAIRLAAAQEEIAQKDKFDYVVINDDLGEAVAEVARIIENERNRRG